MDSNTHTWLRKLGATRPMAPAGDTILALGKWHGGHYPIVWRKRKPARARLWSEKKKAWFTKDLPDEWLLFGVPCRELTEEDVKRIMSHMESVK